MKAYKGFNKDMTCRGFQFEEGKTYHEETAELCKSGFHACEDPIDCFSYYNPAGSVYREVELEDVADKQTDDDTKVCAKTIKIGAEIGIPGIVKAKFEYNKKLCINENSCGDRSALTGGDRSALTGGYSSALTGGDRSALTGGDRSALTGGDGSALTGGDRSALTGGDGSALTGGYSSALTGGDGSALTGGDRSALTGGDMSALTGGDMSALTGGDWSVLRGGINAKFRGGKDTIFAAEWWENSKYKGMKAAIVDGETIKADTWYTLKDGEFVEVEE